VGAEGGNGPSCAPGCDLSKDDAARDALQRTLGRKVNRSFLRIHRDGRIPGLLSFWGVVGTDHDDEALGVMYACCLYRDPEGPNGPAARVLRDLGWANAGPAKRVELARLYDEIGLQAIGGRMGRAVTTPLPIFDAHHPFQEPASRALADGGVVLTHWSANSSPISVSDRSTVSLVLQEIRFGPDGALVSIRSLDALWQSDTTETR
jgi:hypothetical protein